MRVIVKIFVALCNEFRWMNQKRKRVVDVRSYSLLESSLRSLKIGEDCMAIVL
jgi:hypothetical protein